MRALVAALVLLSLSACATDPSTHGVPNLRQVRADYWRSGQPADTDEAWGYLAGLGITDVIKLNFCDEGGGCDARASRFGISVHHLAINPTSVVWQALAAFGFTEVLRPDAAVIGKIQSLLREVKAGSRPRKVLIHCTHGWDRTGLTSGFVLVLNGDMTKDQSWQYMLETNFHRAHLGLWREWAAFQP